MDAMDNRAPGPSPYPYFWSEEFRNRQGIVLFTILDRMHGHTVAQAQDMMVAAVDTVVRDLYHNMESPPLPHQVDAKAVYLAAWHIISIDCGKQFAWEDEHTWREHYGTDPSFEYHTYYHHKEVQAREKDKVLANLRLSIRSTVQEQQPAPAPQGLGAGWWFPVVMPERPEGDDYEDDDYEDDYMYEIRYRRRGIIREAEYGDPLRGPLPQAVPVALPQGVQAPGPVPEGQTWGERAQAAKERRCGGFMPPPVAK
ncbi:hypothetical protein QBC39DRAFT_384494 [Podospora conica]|nr:hypothetical protein QBC39DRAFT_384494 [Schizothecium conicum]